MPYDNPDPYQNLCPVCGADEATGCYCTLKDLRCRYADCVNQHPVAAEGERVTRSECRTDLGLPRKAPDSGTVAMASSVNA